MSKVTYTKDYLRQLNTFVLRTIPDAEKYANLRGFLNDETRTNLSSIIKRPTIPTYIKTKYADNPEQPVKISRGTAREASRRKLYVSKSNTIADKVNEQIREILTKLSDTNKAKLFSDFSKYEIHDDCGQKLIDNIYTFTVDLPQPKFIPVYAELIVLLKTKNNNIYQQLIKKIIDHTFNPVQFEKTETSEAKEKRWKISNILLISEMYRLHCPEISHDVIFAIIDHLSKSISPKQTDSLEVLSELLKKVTDKLCQNHRNKLEPTITLIEGIATDQKYEIRHRFMIQDIVELFNYDSADED